MEIEIIARLIGSLIVVISLLLVVLNFIKRKTPALNDALAIESIVSLGPKEKILLVRCGDNRVLVGSSNNGMTALMVENEGQTKTDCSDAKEKTDSDESVPGNIPPLGVH